MKSGPNVVQKWCKWGIQYLDIEICKHLVDIIPEKESDIKQVAVDHINAI